MKYLQLYIVIKHNRNNHINNCIQCSYKLYEHFRHFDKLVSQSPSHSGMEVSPIARVSCSPQRRLLTKEISVITAAFANSRATFKSDERRRREHLKSATLSNENLNKMSIMS